MHYLLRQYFYVTQLCGVTWIDQKCLQANQNKQTIPIIWLGTGWYAIDVHFLKSTLSDTCIDY